MNGANVNFFFGGVAALAVSRASKIIPMRALAGLATGTSTVAAVSAYMYARQRLIEQGKLHVDHLVGLADGVGAYGHNVLDVDEPVLADLTVHEEAMLRQEFELADGFDPLTKAMSASRAHRSLLRYWVDRLRMEVKVVGRTHADACVMRHILQKMMRAKHYRTHQIAALADSIVGLLMAGTKLDGVAAAVVEASHRRTWLEWALGVPPPEFRRK